VYGSLQLYGGTSQSLTTIARELLETIPARAPNTESVTAGAFAEAARAEFDRYRAVYPDFPVHVDVREDISELMVSFGQLLIPEAAAVRADRLEPLLHHEVGTHVVTYQNGTRQPLTLLTIGLPGYDETQEGLAVLADADGPRIRRRCRTGRIRRQVGHAGPVRHRLVLRLRQPFPICQAGYQTSCVHREFVGGAQAEYLRVPLADGTLAATPAIPDEDLIPSLLAASDVGPRLPRRGL